VPVYEFRCSACQTQFEARQSVEEHTAKPPACPSCGSERLVEPLLSTFYARTARKW